MLALARLLLPAPRPKPGTLLSPPPTPVPRRWEALIPCVLSHLLLAGALVALFPKVFAGLGVISLLILAAVLIQLALIVLAVLRIFIGGIFPVELLPPVIQLATLVLSACAPGWPRGTAVLTIGLLGANALAHAINNFRDLKSPV